MAYNERKMLEDVNGDLIPQYYDPVEDVFKPLTNDPRDVRLTGSNVEKEILAGRRIRTDSLLVNRIEVPNRAKGAFFEHYVYGVTGSFEEGQGHRLEAFPYSEGLGNPLFYDRSYFRDYDYSTDTTSASTSFGVYFGTSPLGNDLNFHSQTHIFILPFIANLNIRWDLRIDGEFSEGEGIDSLINVYWIF